MLATNIRRGTSSAHPWKRQALCWLALLPAFNVVADDLVEYRGGVTLGYGYNAFTGDFTGPCFVGTTKSTFYDSPRGTFLWEETESLEDLRKKLNVSVSAAYKSLGSSAGGRASYLNSYNTSSSNTTIVARNRIETGFDYLDDISLVDSIRRKVEVNGSVDTLALREQCGTHYVQAIIVGGELYALLTQSVRSEREKTEFSTAASGSGGGFSGSISANTALEESRFNSTVKIQGGYSGGNGVNPTAPSELKLQFQDLRESMSKLAALEASTKQRKAAPIDVVLVRISPAGIDAEKLAALEAALRKEEALVSYVTRVRAIAANPSIFNVERSGLHEATSQIENRIADTIAAMRQQMRSCSAAGEAAIRSECNFSRFPIAPRSHDAGLPDLFQESCDSVWQPPHFTTQFEAIPHTKDDASMGGNDMVEISTTYEGNPEHGLVQRTTLRIYEASHRTEFKHSIERVFFNLAAAPAPACFLTGQVKLADAPVRLAFGVHAHPYQERLIDTELLDRATCRTNQPGGDVGYAGCSKIAFKPIRVPIDHVERKLGPHPVRLSVPEWLHDSTIR
ncbi:hypothetical protein [Pseudoxanthomonas mexicana]|uniref:hypothetical protein n=1 Tax=Pseudoxanthomonas mexicana TaxID=128785 RepID=UPI0024E25018|nr:hypothetical protein [Pseudoxanthomonas mexicana]